MVCWGTRTRHSLDTSCKELSGHVCVCVCVGGGGGGGV